jgi:pilus assembly protein CpaE
MNAAQQQEPSLVACTISRDVQIFDLLIEDMETVLGESWGDLSFEEALSFLAQPESTNLQFIAVAMDQEDEENLAHILEIIKAASGMGIKIILITEDVSPASLHALLREGGDEFVPYPLPEGELSNAIARVLAPPVAPQADASQQHKSSGNHDGVIIATHAIAGGTGATTLAVNLAWELANINGDKPPKVCVLDFNFQFGSIATFLDLPRKDNVMEVLGNVHDIDVENLLTVLSPFEQKLSVLTAPTDVIPLDLLGPEEIARLIEMARSNFDYVIIDMPTTVVEWSPKVLELAHVYFATLELDMRSAQNALRLKRLLKSEDLPFEKIRFVLNRAPGFTDLNGKSRIKRLADSLGISIDVLLTDGGKPITQATDHGTPLAMVVPKNALRKEIAKLAESVHEVNKSDAEATVNKG